MKSRAQWRPGKIIFVTGTDTGVGKTIFTGLFVYHLRQQGVHALALKPLCSGSRGDVRMLRGMQDAELTEEEINPFYFPEPVAPLVSLKRSKRVISLSEVVRRIKKLASRCECLLVEGAGGLMVPLGENYFVSDVIKRLKCEVILVSRNQLGTINHTLLSANALKRFGVKNISVALMGTSKKDASVGKNCGMLKEFLGGIPVREIIFLCKNPNKIGVLKKSHKKVKKTLAGFCH
jgi:dethiobiotin synthetase